MNAALRKVVASLQRKVEVAWSEMVKLSTRTGSLEKRVERLEQFEADRRRHERETYRGLS